MFVSHLQEIYDLGSREQEGEMQVDNDQGLTHGQSHAESNGEAKVSLHFFTPVCYGIAMHGYCCMHVVVTLCKKTPAHTCTCIVCTYARSYFIGKYM